MDQQPAWRPRGKARGSFQSDQQTEGTQRPQQSASGPRDGGLEFLQSKQLTEGTQRPQHLQQMQRPQRPQHLQQMKRPQRPQHLQQMQRPQWPQRPQQMQRQQSMQAPQQMPVARQVQAQPQGVLRPTGEAYRPQQVEQVTAAMGSMTTTDIISISGDVVRGRQALDTVQYNQVANPGSSNDGKQDMVLIPLGRGIIRGRKKLNTVQCNQVARTDSTKYSKQGITGRPIQLTANYFPITSYTNWSLYQYRINFNPEEDRISVKRALLVDHKKILGPYIFDGESMFSSTKYQLNTFELTSKRTSDDQIIIISVTFVNAIETSDYANIQVFNLLLRNCLKHLKLQLVGRNYYDALAKIDIPKHKLELWPGYETSIGLFDNGLLLRTEISTKVMRQETVLDILKNCIGERNSRNDFMMNFKACVIGTIVLTPYNNKTYRIDDVDDTSDINSTFTMKDGTVMCYKNYYAEKWNCKSVFDGRQPLLVSKNKKSFIYRGKNEEELVYLVPEFCTLTGLSDAMRNNFNLMRELSVHTRLNPKDRVDRYYNFSNRLQSEPKCLEIFNTWNLALGKELITIPARVLPIEKISCNNSQYDGGEIADWSRNLRSLPMFTSAVIKRWLILTPNKHNIDAFVANLQKVGSRMSLSLPRPEIVELTGSNVRDYVRALEILINERNPCFILCVIKTNRNDIYNIIKRKLCVDRAVPSQVVLMKNVEKNDMSLCTKIAIQINCKLGGAPWSVNIPVKGFMIVGFDVCHDIGNKNISYGALVASLNDTHTSYFSCVESHRSGEELSVHVSVSIAKALNKYKSLNGVLPKSIIIYRDGVGDGQLSHVYEVEVANIKRIFKQFYEQEPPFAFIVVKKHIDSRFFITNSQNANYGNPQPGTVIDQVVTDPSKYEFFLVSQNVRFGTVTPTNYNIIEDTLVNWSPDRMQRLTYKLTHMYYNCSGTIKIPVHCQMAHKLAFLTSQSLRTPPNNGLDELLYFL